MIFPPSFHEELGDILNNRSNKLSAVRKEWVDCPICAESDMRKETDSDGYSLIFCVNHNCGSNGGDNFSGLTLTK